MIKKIVILFIILIVPCSGFSAVTFNANGVWETSFPNEWTGVPAAMTDNDGITVGGGWVCTSGFPDTITLDANNPLDTTGTGGLRHLMKTGANGGGITVYFDTQYPEMWIRYYIRYEEGFGWKNSFDVPPLPQTHKQLYVYTSTIGQGSEFIAGFYNTGLWSLVTQSTDTSIFMGARAGYNFKYWTDTADPITERGDGEWDVFETYVKMDTLTGGVSNNDAICRQWLNGEMLNEDINGGRFSATDPANTVDSANGWIYFTLGSNAEAANHATCLASDYDLLKVIVDPLSSELLDDGNGNKFIGPEDWLSTNPVVTCQADDSTTSTSYAITATYTLDGVRTVASCTWSNSLGGSGTLTATGGNITGTITGLSSGANVITITLTDSAAEIGVCDTTITQTTPTTSVGTIKRAVLKRAVVK